MDESRRAELDRAMASYMRRHPETFRVDMRWVQTHEIGHNLGAKHDPAAYSGAPSGSRYAYISRGPYVAATGKLAWEDRVIMASSLTCSGYCPRLPMFSNPLKVHKFMPFGTVTTHDAAGHIDSSNWVVDEYSSWLP